MADRGVNQVTLLGRLVQDADPKETSGGVPYCWIKLAVNTERPRKNGEQSDQKTEFIRCVMYNCAGTLPYLRTGRQVHIQGRLESYQKDKDSPLLMNVNVDRLILTGEKPAMDAATNGHGNSDLVEVQEQNAKLLDDIESLQAANVRLQAELEVGQRLTAAQTNFPKARSKRAPVAPRAAGKAKGGGRR